LGCAQRVVIAMKPAVSFLVHLYVLVFLLIWSSISVAEPVEVGRVLAATQGVTAQQPGEEIRELRRRSSVYLGDQLTTPEGGRAQLRLDDGEMISMTSSSQLIIEAFEYGNTDQDASEERSVKRLVQGGLRSITGAVDGGGYRVESRAGTIGIRGTSFDVFTQTGEDVYVRAHRGNLFLENEQGLAEFAAGQFLNAAQVEALGQPPVAINVQDLPDFFEQAFEEDTSLAVVEEEEASEEVAVADESDSEASGTEESWESNEQLVAEVAANLSGDEQNNVFEDEREVNLSTGGSVRSGPHGFIGVNLSEPGPSIVFDFAGAFMEEEIQLVYEEDSGFVLQLITAASGSDVLGQDLLHSFGPNSELFLEVGGVEILGDAEVVWGRWIGEMPLIVNDEEFSDPIGSEFEFLVSTQIHTELSSLPRLGDYTYEAINIDPSFLQEFSFTVNFDSGEMSFFGQALSESTVSGAGSLEEFYSATGVSLALEEDGFPSSEGAISGRFVGSNVDGAITIYELDGLGGMAVFEKVD